MDLWLKIIALFGSVLLGGLRVELFKKKNHLKLLLSLSGGFLLTIIFTHILPETYAEIGVQTGYFILLGFLLQLVLEYFSKGAEHGHTHMHHEGPKLFPIAIFLSLAVHAFIESIPLDHHGHRHVDDLFWGVFLHKIPVAVALMTILKASGFSSKQAWIYLLLFALTAPVALFFGQALIDGLNLNPQWILSIAIGMFLHISTTIIFESSEGHKLNALKLVAIVVGGILGLMIS
jgi:zinc transporter ZupT